jgi:hypothetical protein
MIDPEVRYREGFKEGAQALLKGLERFLPTPVCDDAHHWIEEPIELWLASAKEIAATGHTASPLPAPRFQTPRPN